MRREWRGRLGGVYTALVTPFRDGALDLPALDRLVEGQVAAGVAGLVVAGTTGEAPTLAAGEWDRLVQRTVEVARRRVPVFAGAGSNSTARTVAAVNRAAALGADGCMLVAPYYSRPGPGGVHDHFAAVAASTALPLMLYNVPGRAAIDVDAATVGRLARAFGNIVAIKEAGGRCERVTALRAEAPEDLAIHSGDDLLTLPFLALGASGVTSVVANCAPREVTAMAAAWQAGDAGLALALHEALLPLVEALFAETNPVPVKAALARAGAMLADVRLPLTPLSDAARARLLAAMDAFAAWRESAARIQKTAHVLGDR